MKITNSSASIAVPQPQTVNAPVQRVATANQKAAELSWPTNDLVKTGVPWLDDLANSLRQDFGMTHSASVLVPLSALGAVAGSSVLVQTPELLTVAPQINAIWIDRPGSRLRDALNLVFMMPLALPDSMRGKRIGMSDDDIHQEITKLASALRANSTGGQEAAQNMHELLHSLVTGNKRGTKINLDEDDAREKITELSYSLRPDIITANHGFRDLLNPSKLSADGVVVGVNFDGLCGAQLRSLPRNLLADLASLLARTWRPQFRSSSQRCFESSSAFIGLLERSDLAYMLEDPAIRASGLIRTLLLAEAAEVSPVGLCGGLPSERACAGLNRSVKNCWDYRAADNQVIVVFDPDASSASCQYINERYKQLVRFAAAGEGVPTCLSSVLHKIALLLHIAKHKGGATGHVSSIGADTVKSATAITDTLLASHLALVSQHAAKDVERAQQAGEDTEIELIVARLKVRGELTIRDMVRSFHNRNTSEVVGMVARALDAGVVQKAGDKLVLAKDGEVP